MQDEVEIDLRKYIVTLIHHWIWIVGFAIIFAVIGYLATTRNGPPQYQASALVSINRPNSVLNFVPSNQTVQDVQPNYPAYPQIALSDGILSQVYQQWNPRPDTVKGVADLRKLLSAQSVADPSLVQLTTVTGDPAESIALANTWAKVFVEKSQQIYGEGGPDQIAYYQDQLGKSQQQLMAAEQELAAYEGQNQGNILNNQLTSLLQTQNDYLARQRNIEYINQNIAALKQELGSSAAAQVSSTNLYLLQLQVLNLEGTSPVASFPTAPTPGATSQPTPQVGVTSLQVQLPVVDPSVKIAPLDQIALLDQLGQIVTSQTDTIQTRLKEVEPQIMSLQQQVLTFQQNEDRLTKQRDVAQEAVTTLARKVNELKYNAQQGGINIQLISQADASTTLQAKSSLRTPIIAGVAGILLAIAFILAREWWRGSAPVHPVTQHESGTGD